MQYMLHYMSRGVTWEVVHGFRARICHAHVGSLGYVDSVNWGSNDVIRYLTAAS